MNRAGFDATLGSLRGWAVVAGNDDAEPADPDERRMVVPDLTSCFDDSGAQVSPVTMQVSGPWGKLQAAFARAGGVLAIEGHATPEISATLEPFADPTDLVRLIQALRRLERDGYFVGPAIAETTSEVGTR